MGPTRDEWQHEDYLDTGPGSGAGTRKDDKRDLFQRDHPDELPGCLYTPAKTTLKSRNIRDESPSQASEPDRTRLHVDGSRTEEERYEAYWRLHHGFDFFETEEELNEIKEGIRVDPDYRDRYLLCDAVLSQLEVAAHVRETVLKRTLNGLDGGFSWNRWYAGALGLTIAHVLVEMFESPEEVKEVSIWDDIVRVCSDLPVDSEYPVSEARTVNPDALIQNAFEYLSEIGGDDQ